VAFPFESLSFSLRKSFEGQFLGWPMGICWFDEDVVEASFGMMMYLCLLFYLYSWSEMEGRFVALTTSILPIWMLC
jgi:hypothetical protein